MEEQNLTLGQRIAAYRTRVHLSQDSLAELLEVSRQSVSKWETDASTPEWTEIGVMAEGWMMLTLYYQYAFGLHFYRSSLFWLMVAVLGLLTLLKLCRKNQIADKTAPGATAPGTVGIWDRENRSACISGSGRKSDRTGWR